MNLAGQDSGPTTTAPLLYDGQEKLRMVAEAETRAEDETLASVRERLGVGRTCLYESRRRAREALEPRRPGPNPQRRELES